MEWGLGDDWKEWRGNVMGGGGEGGEKRKWGAEVLATSLGEDPSGCWSNSLPQI